MSATARTRRAERRQPLARAGVARRLTPLGSSCYLAALGVLILSSASFAQDNKLDKKAEELNVAGVLTRADRVHPARAGCHFKTYDLLMVAGKTYTIYMASRDVDAYLRVEDAKGKLLAEDDDSGGGQNARIQFKVSTTGTYRIIATTCDPGQTGRFTLIAAPGIAPAGTQWGTVGTPGSPQGQPPVQLSAPGEVVVWAAFQSVNTPSLGMQEDTHGYMEYRFSVANHSPTTAHRVTLAIPRRNGTRFGGYYLRSLSRSLELEPGAIRTLSLFQPNLPMGFSSANQEVIVDGRPLPPFGFLSTDQQRGTFRRQPNWAPLFIRSILTSPFLDTELRTRIPIASVGQPMPAGQLPPFGVTSGNYKGAPYSHVNVERFRGATGPMDSDSWSRHWLGYSSYDGVVLRDADFRRAPPEVRSALWQYVECGGSLLVLGTAELPAHWRRARQDQGGRTYYYPGFGACIVAKQTDLQKWEPEDLRILTTMWGASVRPSQFVQSADLAQQRFPVVDDVGIPIRDLFLVMLVFAVLIGPVNIFVLSWMGRRIWLLWTIPTFSLLTCAAVVAFMTFSDDWEGTVRAEGLTMLDEGTGRGTSIGWLGLYSPQTPGDGLHFSPDTELSPHLTAGSPGSHPGRTIDWSDDQHLKSGWLTARIPAHFLVRTTEPRSERLVLHRRADGSLEIGNALGADITAAWAADADGKVYTTGAVPTKGTAALTLTDRRADAAPSQLRAAFALDWLELVDELSARPQEYLRPGCYIALLDSAPFIPQGLDAATPRRCRSVVFGIMAKR